VLIRDGVLPSDFKVFLARRPRGEIDVSRRA